MGSAEQPGLIPRLCSSLFSRIVQEGREGESFTVEVSYLEIYNEKVRDLLDPKGWESSCAHAWFWFVASPWLFWFQRDLLHEPSLRSAACLALVKIWQNDNLAVDILHLYMWKEQFHLSVILPFMLIYVCVCRSRQALRVREHNVLGPYVDGLSRLAVACDKVLQNTI